MRRTKVLSWKFPLDYILKMNTTKHTLHTARLINNCPTCSVNSGLELAFSQEEKETEYYTKANPMITETLYCHSCNNMIYPVNWTDDIEGVYHYNKKLAKAKNSSIRLKTRAYVLMLLLLAAVSTGVLLILNF